MSSHVMFVCLTYWEIASRSYSVLFKISFITVEPFTHNSLPHISNLAASAITKTATSHFTPYLLLSAQDHRGWGRGDAASASYTSARDVILEMGNAYTYIPRDAACLYTI